MTSPEDAPPVKPPPSFSPALPPSSASKPRYSNPVQSSQPLISTLSESTLNHASVSDVQSPSSSAAPSRTSSPGSRTRRSTPRNSRSFNLSPLGSQGDGSDDIRSLIIRAFSPVVAVCASSDTEALARRKGFEAGFHELLRPFGEKVTGKVLIRDSVGSSRSWDDYGVRFTRLGARTDALGTEPPLEHMEQLLEAHLHSTDGPLHDWARTGGPGGRSQPLPSPLYKLFLRRLLSSTIQNSHETFAHPVACVIAISSRTPSPLESLRQLYAQTSQGDLKPPAWVHPEYLRYYVLVHDEDRDDITQSTALFDQMKRHFGLHCHLLRLRSNQCVVSDDDSTQVPSCEWMTPLQDLANLEQQGVTSPSLSCFSWLTV
jgi:hypothetical protein